MRKFIALVSFSTLTFSVCGNQIFEIDDDALAADLTAAGYASEILEEDVAPLPPEVTEDPPEPEAPAKKGRKTVKKG